MPTASSHGEQAAERLVGVADRLLEPGRDRDDPEEQPGVPVPERDERELRAPFLRRVDHRLLDRSLVREVHPPERGGEREREQRDDHDADVELEIRRPRR